MITFILNNMDVALDLPPGTVLLDALRTHLKLVGTKEGCREGDCGACMVLIGQREGTRVRYLPANSCLVPLAEVHGAHVITIEGLNRKELTPVQQAIVDEGATQCGFCTPGIVVALTAFLLNAPRLDDHEALAALDGNLCRCTGYVSIRRAAHLLCTRLDARAFARAQPDRGMARSTLLTTWHILPDYMTEIPARLKKIRCPRPPAGKRTASVIVGGGTDLFVQQPDDLVASSLILAVHNPALKGIRRRGTWLEIGAATSTEEIKHHPLMRKIAPRIDDHFNLISSTPIRMRATVAGNIVNASPIGDLAIFFIALDAQLTLTCGAKKRQVALKDFFKGYKKLDLKRGEMVAALRCKIPAKGSCINFEKVAKRAHLDIASVNSALGIRVARGVIQEAHLSAGGVAPTPLYLARTSAHLTGAPLNAATVRAAARIAQNEIAPISDVRGSADYKRRLLTHLIYAHFLTLYPDTIAAEELA